MGIIPEIFRSQARILQPPSVIGFRGPKRHEER